MELNHMADWSDEEYGAILGLHIHPEATMVDKNTILKLNEELKQQSDIDWR